MANDEEFKIGRAHMPQEKRRKREFVRLVTIGAIVNASRADRSDRDGAFVLEVIRGAEQVNPQCLPYDQSLVASAVEFLDEQFNGHDAPEWLVLLTAGEEGYDRFY